MTSAPGVLALPGFTRVWLADTTKWAGAFASGLSLQLLLIESLGADQRDLGWVKAAQWLPMLLFGLLAGALIERVPRRPVVVASDAACALSLGVLAVLALTGALTVPGAATLMFVVGTASMCAITAHQSLVPRMVPTPLLHRATARLEQSMTAAESVGPLLAGLLVRTLTAPVALLVSSAGYALSSALLATVRVVEPAPTRRTRDLRGELVDGARWVYGHRTLSRYAVALHVWFFFNSAVMTLLVFYAAQDLGLGPVQIGLALAGAGVSGVVAAGCSPALADRFGLGVVACAADWLTPLAFLLIVLAPSGRPGRALLFLVLGQLVYGLANGLKGPLDLSYRNAVTPDVLRARMNATIRSVNWGTIVLSAPLAGWAAATWGSRPVIWVGSAGVAAAALLLTLSPYRRARLPQLSDG